MQNYNFIFKTYRHKILRFIAVLLLTVCIVLIAVQSYAEIPSAAIVVKTKGNDLRVREGTQRNTKPVMAGSTRLDKYNDILYVPGNNFSWANIGFISADSLEQGQLIVQAGPDTILGEYSFPCTVRGGFRIGWRRGRERGCEEGIRVERLRNSRAKIPSLSNYNLVQGFKNFLKAQADDTVVVIPHQGETMIQTGDTFNGIAVDIIEGIVNITSAKRPEGRQVKAGESYSYPQDTITPIDLNSIVNSPKMQDFLNLDNWLSPDIPERITQGISQQLGEHRASLGLPTQGLASNPGRTPNSSASNNLCNSGTVTQSVITNGRDGTPYRVWRDFSRGREKINPLACGREYWLKEDPSHPNYQIRFVALVNGQGKCVDSTLYKETTNGNLEVSERDYLGYYCSGQNNVDSSSNSSSLESRSGSAELTMGLFKISSNSCEGGNIGFVQPSATYKTTVGI